MAFWQWSRTASADATADPTVNYSEGQAPSSLNDSGRAIMARLAEFRDDTSGLLATGGTSTAYTITTFQGLPTIPNDGQLIAFSPHTVNGVAPTLQADGGTTYPIQSSPGVAIAAASLVAGSPYTAKFSLSNLSWILFGFYANPFNIPLASGMDYWGTAVPNSNFAFPAGQAISRTTYAPLFALVGTTYGTGDGVNTFNLPDMRGRVAAAIDGLGGTPANRLTVGSGMTGSGNGSTGGAETITLTVGQMPNHGHTLHDPGHSHNIPQLGNLGNNANPAAGLSGAATNASTSSAFTGITLDNTGGGSAHVNIQPTITCSYIMRVLSVLVALHVAIIATKDLIS